MYEEINERLAREAERVHRGREVGTMLESLRADLNALVEKEALLKRRLLRKNENFRRISSNEGISSHFYGLLGILDRRIERARCKAAAARMKYEQCAAALDAAREKVRELREEKESLAEAEEGYRELYAEKKALLLRQDGTAARRLKGIESEVKEIKSKLREIEKALSTGEKAHQALRKAADSLDAASGLGVIDILSGGIAVTPIKESHIGDAHWAVRQAQELLHGFRTELAGIVFPGDIEIQLGVFDMFIDLFLNRPGVNLLIQGKIHDSLQRVNAALAQIRELHEKLTAMEQAERSRRRALNEEFKHIILNS